MLLSMTGIGEARLQNDQMTVLVEVRSVNNRHLKLTIRSGERYAALEPRSSGWCGTASAAAPST